MSDKQSDKFLPEKSDSKELTGDENNCKTLDDDSTTEEKPVVYGEYCKSCN